MPIRPQSIRTASTERLNPADGTLHTKVEWPEIIAQMCQQLHAERRPRLNKLRKLIRIPDLPP